MNMETLVLKRLIVSHTVPSSLTFPSVTQERQVMTRREVILSAGALNSPRLLMLSGVGPAHHLRSHGVL
ncbi:Oxygen-dependent choline dehydrogenase [Portunus trituberculatus]|uniref:Oxygen-dependent choline dehydrogenase n=1 Tax=Portunus trituberculatus TaxID=210409 RepID=A0A5B7E192_PORTR|nr:Oxygen-dependent choline dehydrogenase [Portunus trituberculatus]